MTPEDLELIPGIGPDLVEHIRDVVVSYYGQYDDGSEIPQDGEALEQQPVLEMGEEGYNYDETEELAEAVVDAIPDGSTEEVAVPSDEDLPVSADPDAMGSEEDLNASSEEPLEADQDESAKLNNAE
jgi:hypothetical protein